MKLSFTTMACPGRGASGAIGLALRYGYQGVDLRVSDHLGEVPSRPSPRDLKDVRSHFADNPVELAGLLCYNPGPQGPRSGWQEVLDSIRSHLDLAEDLQSPSIRIFAGNPQAWGDPGDYLDRLEEHLATLFIKRASSVQVLVQHHQGSLTYAQALELSHRLDPQRLGIVFSPDHCFLMDEDLDTALQTAPGTCRRIYLSDLGPGSEPETRTWDAVLPGTGKVDLARCIKAFRTAGYESWLTFKWEKIWQAPIPDAETALPAFVEWINTLE